jgi:hypothetical protein
MNVDRPLDYSSDATTRVAANELPSDSVAISAWPTDVDELVAWMRLHSDLAADAVPQARTLELHARVTATWARRSGACDSLIAAAVLHELPFIEDVPTRDAWLPMPWLRTLFPDAVLGPIRLLSAARAWRALPGRVEASEPAGDASDAFLARPHAARALRLAEFEEAALRHGHDETTLPWSALLPVLSRVALL